MADTLFLPGGLTLAMAIALGGCGDVKPKGPPDAGKASAAAKRQKAACASGPAYARLKNLFFDAAVARRTGDRANLDILADYSVARMEDPVVMGWDPELDITRCKGHFVLELPPGAERGFGGARRLESDINYTAQAAADGSGFVYQLQGAEPITAQLAAFTLNSGAYRPPPAIDERQASAEVSAPPTVPEPELPQPVPKSAAEPRQVASAEERTLPPRRPVPTARPKVEVAAVERGPSAAGSSGDEGGEATVRAFYGALGAGDGAAASARVIPEKRSGGAFSPEAITRFYRGLPEPVRLTRISQVRPGVYSVSYRYAAGRSRCAGSAVVSLTNRGGEDLIRSIRALNGC